MKASARIFVVLGCCALVAAIVFPIVAREAAGSMMLGVFALSMLYLGRELYRGAGTDRADDAEAEAEVGPEHVFPASWWPVVMALGIALVAAGLVFTPVIIVVGSVIFVLSVFGWLFQRVETAHHAPPAVPVPAQAGPRSEALGDREAGAQEPAESGHDRGQGHA